MFKSLFIILVILLVATIVYAIFILRSFYYKSGLGSVINFIRNQRKASEDFAKKQQRQARKEQQATRTANGNVIYDSRDPETRSQKIFSEDEGEYVEYKEEE